MACTMRTVSPKALWATWARSVLSIPPLPAMASEAGIEFDLFDVAEIFKSTPYIADLKPGGKYVAKDMHEAGGIFTDLEGRAPDLETTSVLAATPGLHGELLDILNDEAIPET